jgi:hypothetical protein
MNSFENYSHFIGNASAADLQEACEKQLTLSNVSQCKRSWYPQTDR